jgi:predicted secreted hydrolase
MQRRHFLVALAAWRGLLPSPAAAAVEFAPVLPGRRLVFPDDFGAHPDFRTEWWYATGWLKRQDGRSLGFQITFFRVRTGIGESNASRFAPRQIMLAHAAIADPALGRLRHSERTARVGFGHAGFTLGRSEIWIGDWRFAQQGERYQASVRGEDFAYDLALQAAAPPLLNGRDGFSSKAADSRHASYYYSRPQLAVSGSVALAGRTETVTGHAWLDHEWSSELLPDSAQGWDWIGVNFDDGSVLMAFRLRGKEGPPIWSAATLRPAGGTAQVLPPEAVSFVALRQWRSSRTGITYPVEWRVRIGARLVELQPLFDDQELDSRRSTGAVYWEGAVKVSEGGREVGRGYLEMTGYGEKIRVG